MSEKKSLFKSLFGGGKKSNCCNMEIVNEDDKKSNCCNMEIVDEKESSDEEKSSTCDCGGKCTPSSKTKDEAITIKILGIGCKNCETLTENIKLALKELDADANIEKITDPAAIASYGVMSTPGLVINNKVVSFGKVLKTSDIVDLLKNIIK